MEATEKELEDLFRKWEEAIFAKDSESIEKHTIGMAKLTDRLKMLRKEAGGKSFSS
ncbi:MAG: hypothetical protein HQ536_01225 [Parcubacteria group bacterium]|nr:hypothetical protein [Parcubacteria group bacterium]